MPYPNPFLDRVPRRWLNVTSLVAFMLSLITYWLTVAPSVSFWDCPEYIAVANGLEVGHPPGNPLWQLVTHIVCLLAPRGAEALWVNMSSGLWTAIAMGLLVRCIAAVLARCLPGRTRGRRAPLCCLCALSATMCLAWCDSVWFSAVEAEVYAFSLFMSVLQVWVMLKWASVPDREQARGVRWLILEAYITALSIGVHQLNLLVVPALAIIYAYRRRPYRSAARFCLFCLVVSLAVVGLILNAMMPGTLHLAGIVELWAVNDMHMPFWSGVVIYYMLCLLSFAVVLWMLFTHQHKGLTVAVIAVAIFLSGIFMIGDNLICSAFCSVAAAIFAGYTWPCTRRRVIIVMWMLGIMLIGYGSYALIPLRAVANPALNTGVPADVFALRSYVERDQYGSAPLLYGHTPYSRPVAQERFDSAGLPDYSRYALRDKGPHYAKAVVGGKFGARSGMLTASDSAINKVAVSVPGRDAYVVTDHNYEVVTTPELDMWLPRITSTDPSDLGAFEAWVGMDKESMVSVEVSEAVDTEGNPIGKMDPVTGKRSRPVSWRPSYAQSLGMLATYQIGYMYMRYLLWNFSGRQNDFCSAGEADHGNFITGFRIIDNAMLGPQEMLPAEAGCDNPGRNVYFMLPLLLAVIGILFCIFGSHTTRRWGTFILVLWLMTGVAIVVYLNQAPGEVRERDYSFLGSFMAFSFWIGLGVLSIAIGAARLERRLHRQRPSRGAMVVATLSLAVPVLMLCQNKDDHDRSGRFGAIDLARNVLGSMPHGAVLLTDGDNLTFPLWYAQEVEGIRPDVAVVNTSYLLLPSYVASLGIPGPYRGAVPMTGTPADFAYGRFALTEVPADGKIIPLDSLLMRLYSSDSSLPRLESRYALLPAIVGDSVVLDLRNAAGGSSWLRQPALAILDMAASAMSDTTQKQRPLMMINGLSSRQRVGLDSLMIPGLFAARLGGPDRLTSALAAASSVKSLADGGCSTSERPYYDPATARMMRWQRSGLLRTAAFLADSARYNEASILTLTAIRLWPFEVISPDFINMGTNTVHESQLAGKLLYESGKARGDAVEVGLGKQLETEYRKRLIDWQRYYRS
ncbi:MAG: DUF2723 domain-containing protein, partial [Muribaculaceae bacterium]|nr:DUF2723 domain-containing protein [Muribaculaceae bacterium]